MSSPAAEENGDGGGMDPLDLLEMCERVVFSHCCCNGLGTLVMEEISCEAGKRGE